VRAASAPSAANTFRRWLPSRFRVAIWVATVPVALFIALLVLSYAGSGELLGFAYFAAMFTAYVAMIVIAPWLAESGRRRLWIAVLACIALLFGFFTGSIICLSVVGWTFLIFLWLAIRG
jgi:hypothetical protein